MGVGGGERRGGWAEDLPGTRKAGVTHPAGNGFLFCHLVYGVDCRMKDKYGQSGNVKGWKTVHTKQT